MMETTGDMEKAMNNGPPLIIYKDKYRLPGLTTVEYVDEFQEMEVREEDVFIVTYPKSGTHWMQEVVHLIFAEGDLSKINASHRIPVAEFADVVRPEMVQSTAPNFRLQRDLPSPRVFTTHLPCALLPKQIWQKQCKVIYVCRHLKDVICSFYNFSRKIASKFGSVDADTPERFDRYFQSVLRGEDIYGSWFDHILEYYSHRDKDYVLFVTFEDMKKDIAAVVKRVSAFLGRDLSGETVQRIIHGSSFDTMKKNFEEDHQKNIEAGTSSRDIFFNKGTTAQWKTRFTEEQNAQFEEVFRSRMADCELTKDYASTRSDMKITTVN